MKFTRISYAVLAIVLFCGGTLALTQESDPTRETTDGASYVSRTRAVDDAGSRAEKEAERLVSLPPEKIVLLLKQESGLLLEVKKLVVRRAYSQGRVLDPKDLTDDAIFRLVRYDEEVRALVMQQIVDRGYVQAKPTREELLKEAEAQQQLAEKSAGQKYPYDYSQNND